MLRNANNSTNAGNLGGNGKSSSLSKYLLAVTLAVVFAFLFSLSLSHLCLPPTDTYTSNSIPTSFKLNAADPSISTDHLTVPRTKVSPASLSVEPLFDHDSSSSLDSTGYVYRIRGRGDASYRGDEISFCTFTNVIVASNALYFSFQNETLYSHYAQLFSQCFVKKSGVQQPLICKSCFHQSFHPKLFATSPMSSHLQNLPAINNNPPARDPFTYDATPLDIDRMLESNNTNLLGGLLPYIHVWSIHKWVRHHHIAHWAQKLLMFQSVHQHSHVFTGAPSEYSTPTTKLPPVDSILFHDASPPVTDHENVIFNASMRAALSHSNPRSPLLIDNQIDRNPLIYAEPIELMEKQNYYYAAKRISLCPHYGIFSTHPDDTEAFRSAVYSEFQLPQPTRCPPRRAVFLYRHNRGVSNQKEIIAWIKNEYGLVVETVTVSGETSSYEQVKLFESTGLLLSSHSSQLINVLFSAPGAAIIEVSAEFYNADFSEYAHGMGVYFQYALGGEIPKGVPQPAQNDCIEKLAVCEGASHCVLNQRFKCQIKEYPNKPLDFMANITAVKMAVKNAITHLNWLCNGRYLQDRG